MAKEAIPEGLSQLHQAVMLDHVAEKLEMGRRHLDQYRRQGLGMPTAAESHEEEMRITALGNVHIVSPPVAPAVAPTGVSGFAKAAIAAALLGSGAGVGFAAPTLLHLLRPPASGVEIRTESQTIERDYRIGEITIE